MWRTTRAAWPDVGLWAWHPVNGNVQQHYRSLKSVAVIGLVGACSRGGAYRWWLLREASWKKTAWGALRSPSHTEPLNPKMRGAAKAGSREKGRWKGKQDGTRMLVRKIREGEGQRLQEVLDFGWNVKMRLILPVLGARGECLIGNSDLDQHASFCQIKSSSNVQAELTYCTAVKVSLGCNKWLELFLQASATNQNL